MTTKIASTQIVAPQDPTSTANVGAVLTVQSNGQVTAEPVLSPLMFIR
jgi:hypothetical protein